MSQKSSFLALPEGFIRGVHPIDRQPQINYILRPYF